MLVARAPPGGAPTDDRASQLGAVRGQRPPARRAGIRSPRCDPPRAIRSSRVARRWRCRRRSSAGDSDPARPVRARARPATGPRRRSGCPTPAIRAWSRRRALSGAALPSSARRSWAGVSASASGPRRVSSGSSSTPPSRRGSWTTSVPPSSKRDDEPVPRGSLGRDGDRRAGRSGPRRRPAAGRSCRSGRRGAPAAAVAVAPQRRVEVEHQQLADAPRRAERGADQGALERRAGRPAPRTKRGSGTSTAGDRPPEGVERRGAGRPRPRATPARAPTLLWRAMPPEKPHWADLFTEVVTSGLCTGCAGCVIACPHDVLALRRHRRRLPALEGRRGRRARGLHPRGQGLHHVHPGLPALSHLGARDRHLPPRPRPGGGRGGGHLLGHRAGPGHRPRRCSRRARTAAWCRPSSCGRSSTTSSTPRWSRPSRATARRGRRCRRWPAPAQEVLATAGSRYTYSANTLAYPEAIEAGAERIALVGMSCQASVPAVMSARKAGKVARRLALSIGLLCSKTFDDAIFPELFEAKYGLRARRTSRR